MTSCDWLEVSDQLSIKPVACDEGREVVLVQVSGGSVLAVKYWDSQRLQLSNGANTGQVFNELRSRMSSLASYHYLVLPLHVSISREGGSLMAYPYAGRSMDRVCAELRTGGQQDKLVAQLAEMATSVLLVLQKLRSVKPKAWVHRDIKLANLLLGDDGLVRVADFGNACESGDSTTAHDPAYFPPDWAGLLPDGRHTFEDPASLAAANTPLLDLRGLGMALIQGYAGRLPDEVALEHTGSFAQHLHAGSAARYILSHVSTCHSSSMDVTEAQEKARMLRLAQHDWAASIDQLIPDAPALNQFAKLLMGPKQEVPSLGQLLQQPLIKGVHRQVLDTARVARKPWLAHVAACRASVWQVTVPLMQLEQHCVQDCGDSDTDSSHSLIQQFEVLAERYQAEQLRKGTPTVAPDGCGAFGDIACSSLLACESSSSSCSSSANTPTHASSCCSETLPDSSVSHANTPLALSWMLENNRSSSSTAAVAATAATTAPWTGCGELPAAIAAVMAQLTAVQPHAAARIAQLQLELMDLAAGSADLTEPAVHRPAVLAGQQAAHHTGSTAGAACTAAVSSATCVAVAAAPSQACDSWQPAPRDAAHCGSATSQEHGDGAVTVILQPTPSQLHWQPVLQGSCDVNASPVLRSYVTAWRSLGCVQPPAGQVQGGNHHGGKHLQLQAATELDDSVDSSLTSRSLPVAATAAPALHKRDERSARGDDAAWPVAGGACLGALHIDAPHSAGACSRRLGCEPADVDGLRLCLCSNAIARRGPACTGLAVAARGWAPAPFAASIRAPWAGLHPAHSAATAHTAAAPTLAGACDGPHASRSAERSSFDRARPSMVCW